MAPSNPAAEVLYSDQSWPPENVLAWRRPRRCFHGMPQLPLIKIHSPPAHKAHQCQGPQPNWPCYPCHWPPNR